MQLYYISKVKFDEFFFFLKLNVALKMSQLASTYLSTNEHKSQRKYCILIFKNYLPLIDPKAKRTQKSYHPNGKVHQSIKEQMMPFQKSDL